VATDTDVARTIEAQAEAYFAPPRGLNSLWVHSRVMAVVMVGLGAFAPHLSSAISTQMSLVDPHGTWRDVIALIATAPYCMCGLMGIGAIVTYTVACYRLSLAAQYGLPEPGIREWAAFRQCIRTFWSIRKPAIRI
jgi:hypothetical protein